MSLYNFASALSVPGNTAESATWENGFSPEELTKFIEYCDNNLAVDKATIGGLPKNASYEEIRKSKTSWISLNDETAWIYDRLAYITRALNAKNWQYDLDGFVEDFQFTLYDEADSHYTWHIDTQTGRDLATPRKLSLVLQLSDPYEYEGGILELKTGATDTPIRQEKGLVVAFPSHTLHRVTPVTSGIRKSLVVWVSGPPFK